MSTEEIGSDTECGLATIGIAAVTDNDRTIADIGSKLEGTAVCEEPPSEEGESEAEAGDSADAAAEVADNGTG